MRMSPEIGGNQFKSWGIIFQVGESVLKHSNSTTRFMGGPEIFLGFHTGAGLKAFHPPHKPPLQGGQDLPGHCLQHLPQEHSPPMAGPCTDSWKKAALSVLTMPSHPREVDGAMPGWFPLGLVPLTAKSKFFVHDLSK